MSETEKPLMTRLLCLAFLLLMPLLSLGCGSGKPDPPKPNDETVQAIKAEDQAVDQEERAH